MAVVIPAERAALPIEEIARKDVPAGVPYRIVAATDIPEDRSQRELWTADFSQPDGYGIGAESWIAEMQAIVAVQAAQEGDQ
ncbi:hypothetical protein [Aminobacter aminovorans]|uniref:hypothetical protein n=1 Tax=Aminobacter aminovorans TaxID=83263 RepID=UPI001FE06AF9|nr:hypothetical protein [Aminobacter aminovorans]